MKHKVLIFDTPYEAEEINAKLEDNKLETGEKSWNVNNCPPINVTRKTWTGIKEERYYFVSTNKMQPSYIDAKPEKLDATTLKNMVNLRYLGKMVKPYKRDFGGNWILWMIGGMAIAGVIAWFLNLQGII